MIVRLTFLLTLLGSSSCATAFQATSPTTRSTQRSAKSIEGFSDIKEYPTKRVETDEDVVAVATFRNQLTTPKMMVEAAKKKLGTKDNTAEALNGLKTGLLIIGPPIALYQYWETKSISAAVEIYLAVGGMIGGALAVNNFMGKSVYVPSEAESENRILVDYAEGLKRKQDFGVSALSDDPLFAPAKGIMGVVDGQLRNSPMSPPGVQVVGDFPPHVHMKNMLVHDSMRRRGVGQALIKAMEAYARDQTDAELITLEVEDENVGAVRLYEKAGFEFQKNPTTFTKRKFMIKWLV